MYTNQFYNQFNLNNMDQSSFQSSSTNKMNSKFLKQNSTPITVTWNVNAYVKNKKSILKRIKNRVRPDDDNLQFDNNFNNSYNNQVEPVDSSYKHILKNGISWSNWTDLNIKTKVNSTEKSLELWSQVNVVRLWEQGRQTIIDNVIR